ncbi:MAG: hypothetical protein ACJ8DJ_01845, partial [Gemmatimonadales bacterium]
AWEKSTHVAELLERLGNALSTRYRLQRELGQGGMPRVFLDHDLKYNRDVAMTVLRPDLAEELGAARFLHEDPDRRPAAPSSIRRPSRSIAVGWIL